MLWFRKDRNDLALLHDAFELRLRYGLEAENVCEQALQTAPINSRRRQAITELLEALAYVSPKIETYKTLLELHGGRGATKMGATFGRARGMGSQSATLSARLSAKA